MISVRNSPAPRRALWLTLAAWLFAIGALGFNQKLAVNYLELLDTVAAPSQSADRTPLRSTTFNFAADAQTWIRYALEVREARTARLRFTYDDNAPVGREVHWNSGWAWTIAAAGEIRHRFTGEPIEPATEHAARWLNCWVLVGAISMLAGWAAWRFGAVASMFVALGIAASGRFYEGFVAGYVDHHGLLSACVLGLVLGAVGMVTPCRSPSEPDRRDNRRASAVFSAVCGAVGMWISAASIVPPIAIIGLAVVVTLLARGRSAADGSWTFERAVWRTWGIVGATLSAIFYLLEYFPHHLGFRLEVNHPLYALAWLSGAEILVQLGDRYAPARTRPSGVTTLRLVFATVGVLLPAIAIALGGVAVFSLLDPVMTRLHTDIAEFKSIVARLKMFSVVEIAAAFDTSTLIVLLGPVLLLASGARLGARLLFVLTVSAGFLAMELWQVRWSLNASGPFIIATWVLWESFRGRRRVGRVATIAVSALLIVPPLARIVEFRYTLQSKVFTPADGLQPLYRDIAAALRRSQPEGNIILLSSPNASTGVAYYGQFQTIGTLYWENAAGIEAAARIFSAASADEAGKLIFERGITHIAVISEAAFIQSYYELLHPSDPVGFKRSFGYQLEVEQKIPSWLQVLPYTVPEELSSLNVRVLLFKVVPGQSVADALYSLAVAQVAWKSYDGAEATLQRLTDLVPDAPAPWVRRSEVAMARRDWPGAIAAIEKAVALAPADAKAEMYHSAGKAMLSNGQPAAAAQLLRASIAMADADQVAAELAWLLATCPDPTVRNGAEALQIAARLVNAQPRAAGRLVVLAAALAESGRFSDAVAAQSAAIQLSGSLSDALPRLERELSAYQAGQPWRE